MKVKVSTKLRGELSIDAIGFPIKAGQIIELSPEQENSPNVLTAILKGLLSDVDAVVEAKIVKEEPLDKNVVKKMKLTDFNKQKEQEKLDDLEEEKKIQKEIDATATPTEMSAFDMEKRTLLNKEESTKAAMDRINSSKIESLQVGKHIDFSDESTEPDINPLKPEKPVKTAKKAKKTAKKTTKKTTKKKTTAKNIGNQLKKAAKEMSIKPVGTVKPEATADMLVYDNSGEEIDFVGRSSEDISFVDQEQEQEALAKRQNK